ncbi:three-Cys-motif partner protein TcmP [Uliginosibacterium gangwonense]|uniref:three-Cys-motif partner protein TcmP n=1 Tax=Uliginosibacterium gangwonense TaxID=392736 RepID=UPI0004771BAA|nr:three-Cys-motif partner protein TcmP [Uliginosibacterium gangwonense]
MKGKFVLSVSPDPLPELPVERGPSNAGVGDWVPGIKHTNLAKYIDGTRKAQIKFPQRVLIDPFSGPGRLQVKGEGFTRDGGAVVAWRQSQRSLCPFTQVLVGDISPERAEACAARLSALGAPASSFIGPASETVSEMVVKVPKGALCLAYIDPYNLEFLSFSLFETLAKLPHVDFAVHFSLMDLSRNVDMELDPDRARFDDASPGWRCRIDTSSISKKQLAPWFFQDWCQQIHNLGFTVSREMPLVTDRLGHPIYRLVFFSRHYFPNKIWDDVVVKSQNLSFGF